MLIFLLKRELPWKYYTIDLRESKLFELTYLKDTNGVGKLFKNIPNEFKEYIIYSRNLTFSWIDVNERKKAKI